MTQVQTTNVAGLDTVCLTKDELADVMVKDCLFSRANKIAPKVVFSSNGQGISLNATDKSFANIMSQADMIHADGQSVVFASKLFTKKPLPDRIATTDFFHNAARKAQESGLTFFMLGASEEESKLACEKMRIKYPTLKIIGRRNGYFTKDQNQEIIDEINALKPDVLWVALGKPKQEFWCIEMRDKLDVGWIKTCGGLYAFLAGTAPRAPMWMQNLSLEWLFRVAKAPKRLGWRYMTTNPHALWLMITRSK
ncbi:WecB/TagA/CpsF family glycosyltransferase [Colwellia sp. MSW7]|uniref:WecB/TagA/CpsF family glycosyltransferase n=1 Tax=Colwellia maritima TaxID=2912588 RepID=A0ABS9X5F6_9GAMM|nr:WecB/TagA/CpsF family glycosyltransferase [Colwellia maritima]MCI2285473.1 WecB/TagA/CpsF family glycosyltransferase [Colwellia maritima]